MAEPMIEITEVHKHFGKLAVLRGVSLSVAAGEVVVIIGASGSGKTTLLRCINHLEVPDSGEVWVDGIRLTDRPSDIRAVRVECGMVFQQFNLYPHLTVLDNVTLGPRVVRKVARREAEAKARELLEKVGLSDKLFEPEGAANAAVPAQDPGEGVASCDCISRVLRLPLWLCSSAASRVRRPRQLQARRRHRVDCPRRPARPRSASTSVCRLRAH